MSELLNVVNVGEKKESVCIMSHGKRVRSKKQIEKKEKKELKEEEKKMEVEEGNNISSRNIPYIILNDFERDPNLLNYLMGCDVWCLSMNVCLYEQKIYDMCVSEREEKGNCK